MFRFFEKFNPSVCKANLKIAINRIRMSRNRIQNTSKSIRREIAELLKGGKEQKARIKSEQLLQEMNMECALDIVETMCELVITRMAYIASEKECPSDLLSTIQSILYATSRIGIDELHCVRKQFEIKYGREFAENATNNKTQEVHFQLIHLLSVSPPVEAEVLNILKEISKEYKIPFVIPQPPRLSNDDDALNFVPHPSALLKAESGEFGGGNLQQQFAVHTPQNINNLNHPGIVLENYRSSFSSGYQSSGGGVHTQTIDSINHNINNTINTPTAPPPEFIYKNNNNNNAGDDLGASLNNNNLSNQQPYNPQLFPSILSFNQQGGTLNVGEPPKQENDGGGREDDLYERIQRLKNS